MNEPIHPPANEPSDSLLSTTTKRVSFRDMATDAMGYWEPRRLLYNAALAVIVIWHFLASWPASQRAFTLDSVLFLFLLAVLANCCYCAAYIPDLFTQFTGFRLLWLRLRGLLLALGILFAAIITRFFCIAFFSIAAPDATSAVPLSSAQFGRWEGGNGETGALGSRSLGRSLVSRTG